LSVLAAAAKIVSVPARIRPVLAFASALVSVLLAILTGTVDARADLRITNYKDRSTVRHPVVLLRGNGVAESKAKDQTPLFLENLSSDRPSRKMRGQVRSGNFKALAELIPGNNLLQLSAGDSSIELTIRYRPQSNANYVRVIWMTDSEGDTRFATPNDDDPQDYSARLDTAAKLMQCFTAERMYDSGHGRRTFQLELDAAGKVVIHTLAAPQKARDYHLMEGADWWQETRAWLNREYPDPLAKNLVLAAFTRKDLQSGKMLSHTALGGGDLGLFGSASIFSWPRSLPEACDAFLNSERIDPTRVHDDSSGRGTYWGAASTTIGATLHEMYHTFGLPHCRDRFAIMTRGFDYLNRFFTFEEPASARRLKPFAFDPGKQARIAEVSASYLRWSPWFRLDEKADDIEDADSDPVISFDPRSKRFSLAAESPIRWLGFWHDDTLASHRDIPVGVALHNLSLSLAECEAELGPENRLSRLTALSENGRAVTLRFVGTKSNDQN